MKIKDKSWFPILFIGFATFFFSCEDEAPDVIEIDNYSAYSGDWNGVESSVFKNDGETVETSTLKETLRLEASGSYQVLDSLAMVQQDGFFSITEITGNEYNTGTTILLQLVDVQEDTEDLYENINGENVFYSNSTFNVIESSGSTLVLSNARQEGSDFVTFTYSK